jgi:putative transposase
VLLLHSQPAGATANLLVGESVSLRDPVATTRRGYPFTTDAFVVLPDHLPAVWSL